MEKQKAKIIFSAFNIILTLLQVQPVLENGKKNNKQRKIFCVNFGCVHNAWEYNRWEVKAAACPQRTLCRFALRAAALLVPGSSFLLSVPCPASPSPAGAPGEAAALAASSAPCLQPQLVAPSVPVHTELPWSSTAASFSLMRKQLGKNQCL